MGSQRDPLDFVVSSAPHGTASTAIQSLYFFFPEKSLRPDSLLAGKIQRILCLSRNHRVITPRCRVFLREKSGLRGQSERSEFIEFFDYILKRDEIASEESQVPIPDLVSLGENASTSCRGPLLGTDSPSCRLYIFFTTVCSRFHSVHGDVRRAHQCINLLAVFRIDGNTDAH
jgi:hypothetical protein